MKHRKPKLGIARLAAAIACALLLGACDGACTECNALGERFLAQLGQGETRAAFDTLSERMPTPLSGERSNALINTSNIQIKRFGDPSGFDLVETEWAGDRVVRMSWLLYQPQRVSRWTFHFYRPANEWQLFNFTVTDEVTLFR